MKYKTVKLTEKTITSLQAGGGYTDENTNGLTLLVSKTKTRSWQIRKRVAGAQLQYRIGQWPAMQYARAKEICETADAWLESNPAATNDMFKKWIEDARHGRVLVASDSSAMAVGLWTLKECAEHMLANKRFGKSGFENGQISSILTTHILPNINQQKSMRDLTLADMLAVFRARDSYLCKQSETLFERVQGVLAKIMRHAQYSAPETVFSNLTDGKLLRGALEGEMDFRPPNRSRPVPVDRAPAFYAQLQKLMDKQSNKVGVSAEILALQMLTCARPSELCGSRMRRAGVEMIKPAATWSEFDFDAALWTVPARRMKNRKKHEVPLSGAALEVLQRIQDKLGKERCGPTQIICPAYDAPLDAEVPSNAYLDQAVKRVRMQYDYVVNGLNHTETLKHLYPNAHGMRSTAANIATWSGFTDRNVSHMLSHSQLETNADRIADSELDKYQDRASADQRRPMMEAIADYLLHGTKNAHWLSMEKEIQKSKMRVVK